MRVVISVPGKFHAYDLARELQKRNSLGRLFTSFPKFKTKDYGIPASKACSIILPEIIFRGWRKLPVFLRNIYNPHYLVSSLYDDAASRKLEKCDICVAWSGYGLKTIRRAKQLGAKTVIERGSSHIVYQTEILKEEYEKFDTKIRLAHPKIIEKELQEYSEADHIAIPSSFVKRTFLNKGFPENKLIQVPYGVDLTAFRQIPKEDDIFRVIFAGGMSLRKGVHYLLQAFAELNLPNSELLLIGGMNDEIKPFLKKFTSSDDVNIKYIGHKPQKELYKYFSMSSVFTIASIEEGLALVIPQAMACGLPVIATTNTGAEDIVRDGKDGFIVPIRDVRALKEKLLYLYENKEMRRAMGQSAKERVSTGFTWDDYGDKIMVAYERILK